jgi:hypothetical protein
MIPVHPLLHRLTMVTLATGYTAAGVLIGLGVAHVSPPPGPGPFTAPTVRSISVAAADDGAALGRTTNSGQSTPAIRFRTAVASTSAHVAPARTIVTANRVSRPRTRGESTAASVPRPVVPVAPAPAHRGKHGKHSKHGGCGHCCGGHHHH